MINFPFVPELSNQSAYLYHLIAEEALVPMLAWCCCHIVVYVDVFVVVLVVVVALQRSKGFRIDASHTVVRLKQDNRCIYKWSLSAVRLFVFNKRQNRLNRLGPNFVWNLTWPQGMFMNDQNFQNLCLKDFISVKFWKRTKKYWEIRKLFCLFWFYTVQREDAQRKRHY